MKKFKAVVVGAGGISRAWFPQLAKQGVEVAGVVDIDIGAAKSRIAEYGIDCEAGTDLAAMLRAKRPDFVVDLTIPSAHCKVSCDAMRAGCHVIGEKPLADTVAEARRMIAVSEETGLMCMVSQSRRYEGRHVALRNAIAKGRIGRVTTMDCAFYIGCHFGGFRDEMASPLILDMAIHHFDLARMFTGADPVAVYAREFNPAGSWYKGDAAASCVFEMSDGSVFSYRGSWCAEGMHTSWHGDWRIVGTKGTILYERDQQPRGETAVEPARGEARRLNYGHKPFEIADAKIAFRCQGGALREFLRALAGGPAPQGLVQDNIHSLEMVCGAIESSRKGRRVVIARR